MKGKGKEQTLDAFQADPENEEKKDELEAAVRLLAKHNPKFLPAMTQAIQAIEPNFLQSVVARNASRINQSIEHASGTVTQGVFALEDASDITQKVVARLPDKPQGS